MKDVRLLGDEKQTYTVFFLVYPRYVLCFSFYWLKGNAFNFYFQNRNHGTEKEGSE